MRLRTVVALSLLVMLPSACTTESVTVVEVDSVEVSPDPVTTVVGGEIQMQAAVRDKDGRPLEDAVVEWGSDEPAIASVNSSGVLVAHSAGWTAVYATFGRVSGSAMVFVALP